MIRRLRARRAHRRRVTEWRRTYSNTTAELEVIPMTIDPHAACREIRDGLNARIIELEGEVEQLDAECDRLRFVVDELENTTPLRAVD